MAVKKKVVPGPKPVKGEITGSLVEVINHVFDNLRPNPMQTRLLEAADFAAYTHLLVLLDWEDENGEETDTPDSATVRALATLLAVYPASTIAELLEDAVIAYQKNRKRCGSIIQELEKRLLKSHLEQLEVFSGVRGQTTNAA
jgi:hypothetical protein